MVAWCTQNVYQDGSSFTWQQPCDNKTALTPLWCIFKTRSYKRLQSGSQATTLCPQYVNPTSEDMKPHIIASNKRAVTLVSLLESREQHYIKAINWPVSQNILQAITAFQSLALEPCPVQNTLAQVQSKINYWKKEKKRRKKHPPNNTVWNTISALSNTTNHAINCTS